MPFQLHHLFPVLWMSFWIQVATSIAEETSSKKISRALKVDIASTVDGTLQKAIWCPAPETTHHQPLLVALHSWSGNYLQASGEMYLKQAKERNWHFIHPDFRGINQRPEATCSDLVVSDILDAVEFARTVANVDTRRIYLVGASGGGMASLMLAAKAPQIWAGVSSWVPISDLLRWHAETLTRELKYTAMIEASCGGKPHQHAAIDFQYWNRSPIHFLTNAKKVRLDINAGIMDGHTGSVPVGHSLRAFNAVAAHNNQFSEDQIQFIETNAKIPLLLSNETSRDPSYGKKRPLLRRQSGKARLTLFRGTHEIIVEAALEWLSHQELEDGADKKTPL
ncbi:MAG: prolyl oligopeptidase family serine peptidase [Verrucomicrobia bacterium]|nr:prolyl oligopeptidase family serine peptidase [Verrucomicrobiota bacterium]MBT6803502.1 prolyl oligopeptidase family serine peptidase [Verrucomicrobiota bacterium]MBT7537008.1 prolyl oligopeptidase family serine peptidase [Verrucomicrobiota bacterium]MBT7875904.1 prolyl oligopeptidase family serine peptidase [Verrucomicrobiota bacterium]